MQGSDKPLIAAAAVLGICTVVLTALVVRRELAARPSPGFTPIAREAWRDAVDGGTHLGAREGADTLVVFSDYQCPGCRDFDRVIEQLTQQGEPDPVVVYRHFPLRAIHPVAEGAASAAECAAAQGAFQAYHRALFARQDSLGRMSWIEIARAAMVPVDKTFRSCISEQRFITRVTDDLRLAEQLRLTATPSVLLNGVRFSSVPTLAQLTAAFRSQQPPIAN